MCVCDHKLMTHAYSTENVCLFESFCIVSKSGCYICRKVISLNDLRDGVKGLKTLRTGVFEIVTRLLFTVLDDNPRKRGF